MKLDVCITATVRPEVLRMTLQSFSKNLLNKFDCRAIINVDPVGDTDNHTQMETVNLCRNYFREVICCTPSLPSFASAVRWCWQQVETELFFHMEDDWLLRRKINSDELLSLFEDSSVVSVGVAKYDRKRTQQKINAGYVTPIKDGIVSRRSFSLAPGFMRTAYIQQIATRMELNKDPESQYEEESIKLITDDYPRPTFLHICSNKILTVDTGRTWMRSKSLHKTVRVGAPTIWYSLDKKTIFKKLRKKIYWHIKKRIWQIRYC